GAVPRPYRPRNCGAYRCLLRSYLARSARRARRHGLRRRRVWPPCANRAHRRALGDTQALHAERTRRVQSQSPLLHDRGDIRDRVDQIDIKRCPLFLLSGEYDYSCTSEGTVDVAKRTGATATIMQGLGHFPMSENPEKFISYLLPVLEKIRALKS